MGILTVSPIWLDTGHNKSYLVWTSFGPVNQMYGIPSYLHFSNCQWWWSCGQSGSRIIIENNTLVTSCHLINQIIMESIFFAWEGSSMSIRSASEFFGSTNCKLNFDDRLKRPKDLCPFDYGHLLTNISSNALRSIAHIMCGTYNLHRVSLSSSIPLASNIYPLFRILCRTGN